MTGMTLTRALVFLAVVSTITAAIHSYLWWRLVRDPNWPGRLGLILSTAIILLGITIPAGAMLSRVLPRSWIFPLGWLSFTWMGLMFLLLVQVFVVDLAKAPVALYGLVMGSGFDAQRRLFLARSVAIGAGALAALVGGFGVFQALRPLKVHKVTVPIRGLPKEFVGYRILQLTDVHVGPLIGKHLIQHMVERCNALKADAIAITGDLVDGSVMQLREHVAPLQALRAEDGVFFVTGNHEYYSGVADWEAHLSEGLGIKVLRNECIRVRKGESFVDIAGVDDWSAAEFGGGHGPDLGKALSSRETQGHVVLLAHQPRQFPEAVQHGVSLQLSGHTHGGQIFPFNYLVKLQQPYVQGLHQQDDSFIYVSPGTGFWGPPMRVGTRAEITEVTLVNA